MNISFSAMNIAVFFVILVPNVWFSPVPVLLLFLTAGRDLLRKNIFKLRMERVDLLVFILLILCSQSFLNVDLSYRSPQNYLRYFLGTYLLPAMAYFAFRLIQFSDEKVRGLRKTIFISGAVLSAACLFEFIFSHPLNSVFDNPNQWIDGHIFRSGSLVGGSIHAGETMAGLVALTLPFALYLRGEKRPALIFLLLSVELLGLAVTFSRAGYISVLVCLIAAVLLVRGIHIRTLVPILALLLLLSAVMRFFELPFWLNSRLIASDSSLERIPRFWAGVDFLKDNIQSGLQTALLGRGYLSSYLLGGYYIKPGYGVSAGSDYFLEGGFHNGYLILLADQGILAFLCYVIILIIAGRRLLKHCRQFRLLNNWKPDNPGLLEPVGWGLVIVVHLVTETVHWQFYFPQRFYFFMALAMLFNLTSPSRLIPSRCNDSCVKLDPVNRGANT